MKNIFKNIILLATVVLCGCSSFDDSELRDRIDGYKKRIETLQQKAETLNAQVEALSRLTNGNVITAVTQNSDGRYVITYKDDTDKEYTVVLATMDDLLDVPVLGVALDEEEGIYYWTQHTNGKSDWLRKGEDGERIPVRGNTPTLVVDDEGCWTVDGERILDGNGNPLSANTEASSVFKDASFEGGVFTLTLGNGEVLKLQVFNTLNLKLQTTTTVMIADASAGCKIKYELTGEAKDKALIAIAKEAGGVKAELDRETQTIDVAFDNGFSDRSNGHIIVMAYDLADNVIVKPVFFTKAKDTRIFISSAEELVQFARDVNSGVPMSGMQIFLSDDIDMSGVTDWTPIGEASFSWASHSVTMLAGNPFKGHFDGNGHTIKNFNMVCKSSGEVSNAWGMFGALTEGAIVENIVFDKSCSLTVSAKKGSDTGVLAGLVYNSTVRNIENRASMSISSEASSGDNIRLTMGIIGFAFASDSDTRIENVKNYGDIKAESAGNTKSGATGVHIGGILGFGSILNNGTHFNYMTECDNYGNLDTKVGRASGIVGTANRGTVLSKCTNYGDNVNSFATSGNARIGNITCLTGTGSKMTEVVNRGDLICTTSGAAGGIVCLVDHENCEFSHCANYGRIITDKTSYRGTFFGQCNKNAVFTACVAQGDLGTYEGGSYSLTGLNAANYFQYIGDHSSAATYATASNIIWAEAEAAAEFSVTPAQATIDVWGTSAVVAELSAADYDWTVTADEWLHTVDLSGNAVTEGTKKPVVQNIKITADRNMETSPRTGTVTFTAKGDAAKTAVMTVTQEPVGDAFPSKWVFSSADLPIYGDAWTSNHIIPATTGAAGSITAVRGEKYASTPLDYTIYGNKPTVSTMGEGDYWLYTFPVQHLDAGTAIEFDATMGGGSGAPKYFIVEYFEDGEWKSVEEDLRTAPEDATIKYTYRSSGNIDSSGYQHATVMQTIRLAKAIDNDELKIRCRAVGSMTASDTSQDITKLGRSLMPLYGFTASYAQNLGTATPKDTKKVLCLGNSFSYYNNPVWMLKEIAYSQGHYMRIRAHLKGSQTFTQHCSLLMSNDAINEGGYDYAFIQDQSQNPAKYGQTGDVSILNAATTLAGLIKAQSPDCQMILEETWAFSSGTYGGFGSYEQFDALNEKGAFEMAQANSAWMSPIGKAFKEARKNTSINLYYTDNKHQSAYGAYLKACVNYLVIYGESFTGDVPACGIDPEKAAYLRGVAEQTVLGHESENLIVR